MALASVLAACGRLGFDRAAASREADAGGDAADLPACTALFTGHRSTCFLTAGGARWCAGDGAGDDLAASPASPTYLPGDDGWTSLSLGWFSNMGIRRAQTWTWTDSMSVPALSNGFADWDQVSYEINDYCYLHAGTLSCDDVAVAGTWAAVDAGNHVFCALADDHSLWCWGTDANNVLGQGVEPDGTVHAAPTQVGSATDWHDVSIGDELACGRKLDNTIWCWGAPSATGTNGVDTLGVPTQIRPDTDWTSLDVRWNHACAQKPDGHPWCWGFDEYGLEVVPGEVNVAAPTDTGRAWDQWRMGGHHYCGEAAGRWFCYGWNAAGQLAEGDTISHGTPGAPLCAEP